MITITGKPDMQNISTPCDTLSRPSTSSAFTASLAASAAHSSPPTSNFAKSLYEDPRKDVLADSLNDRLDSSFARALKQATPFMIDANERYSSRAGLDTSPMRFYIQLGHRIQQAMEVVGSWWFDDAFKEWRRTGTVGFSLRSAQRYMLIARNAEAILAAGCTRVMQAENFASERECAAHRRGYILRMPASEDVPQAITDRELGLLAEVGRLPMDAQAAYLQQLVVKLASALRP